MDRPKVTLYFDLHSTYSYLAYYLLRNSPMFRDFEVTYKPVLLVGLIKAVDGTPPWNSPNKTKWLETDIDRWSRQCRVPWKQGWPENFPFKATTMKVQRALIACSLECPEHYLEVVSRMYHAFWVEKKGVQLPAVHQPIIASVVGERKAAVIVDKSSSEEVKALLRQNTDEAVDSGSPGLPWIKAENVAGQTEYFWGFDHLGQVARFLELGRLSTAHL